MADPGFAPLPSRAAWVLQGLHQGFEVAQFSTGLESIEINGTTVGVEDGVAWNTSYAISLSTDWRTQRAQLTFIDGTTTTLEVDESRRWTRDAKHVPSLDGLDDLDIEASTVTNTIAVHRLALAAGEAGASNAAYVRTENHAVETLQQTYRRLGDGVSAIEFEYAAPRFDYRDILVFGRDGLVTTYPSISRRVL